MSQSYVFTLSQQDYEALIGLARQGTKKPDGSPDHDKALALDNWLKKIEKDNGIHRDAVWVQWQELNQPLPPNTNFPEVWPPELRIYVEKVGSLISRADLDEALRNNAKKPTSILFTRDPGAMYGWAPIEDYT